MKFSEARLAFIDLETTGFSTDFDRIVEIAVVVTDHGEEVSRTRHLVNPLIHIPNEASEVHKVWDEHVKGLPTFDDLAVELSNLLSNVDICVAYNAQFDAIRLAKSFRRAKCEVPRCVSRPWIDPYFVLMNPESKPFLSKPDEEIKNLKLTTVCAHFGVKLNRAHSALDDTVALKELFFAIYGDGNVIPDDLSQTLLIQCGATGFRNKWSGWVD